MGTLSGLQEYQVYVYNCEKFNKSAEKAPLLEWQDLIDATSFCHCPEGGVEESLAVC